jgi:ABC-type antimicrobial peptide transport system permease subunit
MLRNYLTIAWRNVLRYKSYSLINVLGLTLGVSACLLILLVVRNELGYDDAQSKRDRIYRVTLNAIDFNANVSFALVPALRTDFPELPLVTQVDYQHSGQVQVGQNRYNEEGFAYADPEFVQLFEFNWLAGNPAEALRAPNTAVLTRSIALKYFGKENPLGKTLTINNQRKVEVTGLIEDPQVNTHLPFVFLVSWETVRKERDVTNFWSIPGGSYVYLLLPENYPVEKVQKRIGQFLRKNWAGSVDEKTTRLPLQPLQEIHFDQRYINNVITPTGRETFYALAGVSIFIILTACINFINMATAQAVKRSREVGVRKTLGAFRGQLIRQSLGETALLVGIAVGLALLLVKLFLPLTGQLLNIRIDLSQLTGLTVAGAISSMGLLTILLAGVYPALIQSGFEPVQALKSKMSAPSPGSVSLRKSLVVVQFVFSQILLAGTLIVASQMDFFRNGQLGFDKEAVITFDLPDNAPGKQALIREQLRNNAGVQQISLASAAPVYNTNFTSVNAPELGVTETDVTEVKFVDENYLDMYKIRLLAGEPIRKRSEQDTVIRAVVNQTLVQHLGLKREADAIGRHIVVNGGTTVTISGVVQDFQSESRHKKIRACVLAYNPAAFGQVSVKLRPERLRETVASIDKMWSAMYPDFLFKYAFLDDRIASMYRQEEKVYNAFLFFSAIAIFIGCLGLYGLVSFIAVQRTREVGIRKVMGATAGQIVGLFTKEFVWLIVIAFLIATPLAWYAMDRWLQSFAYRIQIGPSVFLVSVLLTFLIAALTVGYQSVKAALADPVKSLRSE